MKSFRKPVSSLESVTNFYRGSHKRNGQLLAESPKLGMEFTHHQEKRDTVFTQVQDGLQSRTTAAAHSALPYLKQWLRQSSG